MMSLDAELRPAKAGPTGALDRRDFFKVAAATAGLASLAASSPAQGATAAAPDVIDTNVYLSRWPLRRLPNDETASLAAKLRAQGVTQAWAGSFDGLLHRNLGDVNARLAEDCRNSGGLFVPFGSVNPKLPDWEDELRRCVSEHRMPGIRLHPNYHGYALDDGDFLKLLRLASERNLLVQLAWIMEDRRMMHPLLQVEPPVIKPLAETIKKTPGLRLMLLNATRSITGKVLSAVIGAGEVFVEIAMVDTVNGVGNLMLQVPPGRVLFGSFSPLFYFESSLLKLKESPLTDEQLRAIRCENAQRLLAKNP